MTYRGLFVAASSQAPELWRPLHRPQNHAAVGAPCRFPPFLRGRSRSQSMRGQEQGHSTSALCSRTRYRLPLEQQGCGVSP